MNDQLVAGVEETARHAGAHDAETDKCDASAGHDGMIIGLGR
jgi:hypothetical protein